MVSPPNIAGRLAIPAAAEQNLYTVPAARAFSFEGAIFANRSAGASSFRLSISPNGAATADADYLYYDFPLTANNTLTVNLDATLQSGSVIRVYSATGNVSVTLFGKNI